MAPRERLPAVTKVPRRVGNDATMKSKHQKMVASGALWWQY
jgi:hypothetical protein